MKSVADFGSSLLNAPSGRVSRESDLNGVDSLLSALKLWALPTAPISRCAGVGRSFGPSEVKSLEAGSADLEVARRTSMPDLLPLDLAPTCTAPSAVPALLVELRDRWSQHVTSRTYNKSLRH